MDEFRRWTDSETLNLKAFVTPTRSLEYLQEQYKVFFSKYRDYRNLHILFVCWLDGIDHDRQIVVQTNTPLMEYEYYV